jgi:hypothetical protein
MHDVELGISDAHKGIKTAVSKIPYRDLAAMPCPLRTLLVHAERSARAWSWHSL